MGYEGHSAEPRLLPQAAKKTSSGPVFLGISNLCGGRIDLSEAEHLSEEDFLKWTRRVTPRSEDIVFSYETRLGEAALIPKVLRCCLGRRMALMRVDRGKADPRFLLYAFLGPEFQELIRARTVRGSTVERIALMEFPGFPISVPSLGEQRAIASVLGALDDKIELNRRMNETLEPIARAIFKSWFVDFDPVRAKMEGRQPFGMDAETAALFPSSLEDSPLGKIPRGWRVATISEVAGTNERTLRRHNRPAEIEYIDISSVSRGRLLGTTRYSADQAPSRAQRLVQHGDSIWSMVRPNRESYLLIHDPSPDVVVSTGFVVLTPKSVSSGYLYAWVTTAGFVQYLSYSADGSAYPAVRPERFSEAEILVPPPAVVVRFEGIVEPLRARMASNGRESITLGNIRDVLLPKLICGEIRLKDAEKRAEAAL